MSKSPGKYYCLECGYTNTNPDGPFITHCSKCGFKGSLKETLLPNASPLVRPKPDDLSEMRAQARKDLLGTMIVSFPPCEEDKKRIDKKKLFDPAKPCTTRDGRKVRILCTDARGDYPIIGIVDCGDFEHPRKWRNDGWPHSDVLLDQIFNISIKREGWVVMDDSVISGPYIKNCIIHKTREDALLDAGCGFIVHIEWDE